MDTPWSKSHVIFVSILTLVAVVTFYFQFIRLREPAPSPQSKTTDYPRLTVKAAKKIRAVGGLWIRYKSTGEIDSNPTLPNGDIILGQMCLEKTVEVEVLESDRLTVVGSAKLDYTDGKRYAVILIQNGKTYGR
jgi:hypothetical protein